MANHYTRVTPELSGEQRAELERWVRRPKTAQALVLRARIVLRCAEGNSCDRSFKNPLRGCGAFLGPDHAAIPRLSRYSTGLRAPSEILIRFSLYQRM